MKSIVCIRHAQSVPQGSVYSSDFERPLSYIGEQQALLMSSKLKNHNVDIQHWYASSSTRTSATLNIFTEQFAVQEESITIDEKLYLISLSRLKEYIASLPDRLHCAAIIGHNPAITDLAYSEIPEFTNNVPTCGIYKIDWQVGQWTEVFDVKPKLVFFAYPKQFESL